VPVAPVSSGLWKLSSKLHDNFVEEIGWQELTETVAAIYAALPGQDKPRTRVLASNYGEAGAINLYRAAHGLPEAISGINSYRLRGYGEPPPQTLIVLGFSGQNVERLFARWLVKSQTASVSKTRSRGTILTSSSAVAPCSPGPHCGRACRASDSGRGH
jgi:hypothetical protein